MQTLRNLYHCVYNLTSRLVLVTKYHRRCMTGPMLDRLAVICRGTAAKWECEVLEFNGEADHVNLHADSQGITVSLREYSQDAHQSLAAQGVCRSPKTILLE